jgi:hypothetical protein
LGLEEVAAIGPQFVSGWDRGEEDEGCACAAGEGGDEGATLITSGDVLGLMSVSRGNEVTGERVLSEEGNEVGEGSGGVGGVGWGRHGTEGRTGKEEAWMGLEGKGCEGWAYEDTEHSSSDHSTQLCLLCHHL